MLKKTATLTITFFLFFSYTSSFANLDDFKRDTEREEDENRGRSGGSSGSGSSGSSSSSDDAVGECMGECLGYCLAATFALWVEANAPVYYKNYPYEKGKKEHFFLFDHRYLRKSTVEFQEEKPDSYNYNNDENNDSIVINIEPSGKEPLFDKSFFFSVDGGGHWCRDDGNGFFASFRGKICSFFGPEMEYRRVIDGNNHLDHFAIGANMPLFQFDGFAPDFYFQYSGLRGILERNGFAYGLIIHSYPVYPFTLMFRVSQQRYEYINFMDYEGRIGIALNRFEIFGGWRHMKAKYANIGGPVYGIRIYF